MPKRWAHVVVLEMKAIQPNRRRKYAVVIVGRTPGEQVMAEGAGKTDVKFVVVLNKNLESGKALNAAAHMAAGLVARAGSASVDKMMFISFTDKDGGEHPSISALSLIVLRATSNEIRKVRREAISRQMLFTDFTSSMTGDTYVEQLDRTKATAEQDLEYYGICLFGSKSELAEFTGKLSLWR